MRRSIALLSLTSFACAPQDDASLFADAGPARTGAVGQPFVFDGGASGGGETQWRVLNAPLGSRSALLYADTPWPQLTPDREGVYTLELQVCEAGSCVWSTTQGYVGAAGLEVLRHQRPDLSALNLTGRGLLRPDNQAPVAEASQRKTLARNSLILLQGGESYDPDGDPLTYRWTFKALPSDSQLGNSNITGRDSSAASFTPDAVGSYQLQLRVSDGLSADAVLLPEIVLSTIDDNDPFPD